MVLAVFWFVQIDSGDDEADKSSLRATVAQTKRTAVKWVQGTGLAPDWFFEQPEEQTRFWLMDPSIPLPCTAGAICEVAVRFPSHEVARFIIERSNYEDPRLTAVDPFGMMLMKQWPRAQLEIAEADGTIKSTSIARRDDGRWTLATDQRGSPSRIHPKLKRHE